ncbi:MAG: hypothetical protein AABZ74_04610 [Cyanobacteriota bacterium]
MKKLFLNFFLSSLVLFSCTNDNVSKVKDNLDTSKTASPTPIKSADASEIANTASPTPIKTSEASEISNTVKSFDLNLVNDIPAYSESMSSAFGMGLTPRYDGNIDDVNLKWETDHGYFVNQDVKTQKIQQFGTKIETSEKIYLSYSSSQEPDLRKNKTPITVKISVFDKKSNKMLSEKAFTFEFDENFLLRPKKNIDVIDTKNLKQYDREFTLKIGETVGFPDKSELKVERLVSDSRCPTNARCIWAGNTVFDVSFKTEKSTTSFRLTREIGKDELAEKVIDFMSIKLLKILPENVGTTDKKPTSSEYILTFIVNKK